MTEQIAAEGGLKLDDACVGREVKYPIDGKWDTQRTAHCGMECRFEIDYDPTTPVVATFENTRGEQISVNHPGEKFRPRGPVRVCATDDNMGLWPRYAGCR